MLLISLIFVILVKTRISDAVSGCSNSFPENETKSKFDSMLLVTDLEWNVFLSSCALSWVEVETFAEMCFDCINLSVHSLSPAVEEVALLQEEVRY